MKVNPVHILCLVFNGSISLETGPQRHLGLVHYQEATFLAPRFGSLKMSDDDSERSSCDDSERPADNYENLQDARMSFPQYSVVGKPFWSC